MFKKIITLLFLPIVCYASTIQLLEELTNAHGGSGFEGPVRDILKRELGNLGLPMQTDRMGNLYAFRETDSGKPKVLLMAHMDEVAFIIREISDDGYLYFDQIGWWLDPVVVGEKWVVTTAKGPIKGVTGMESSHILEGYPAVPAVSKKKMFVDIGVSSKEEAEALGIRPGLPITPDVKFEVLNGTNRYCAKAFDDRVALVAILKALENVKDVELPCEVTFAATVQEEFVMKGSQAVFATAKPEVVVNVEVGIARDFQVQFPNHLSHHPKLGKGPTIFVFDCTLLPSNDLVEYFSQLATSHAIPFQYESQNINYGHDGCRLQGSGTGTHVINLGIPTRYVHSHYGVIDRSDLDHMVTLIENFLRNFGKEEMDSFSY